MAVLKGVISLYRAWKEKPIERYKARIGHLTSVSKRGLVQNYSRGGGAFKGSLGGVCAAEAFKL